MNNKFSLKKLLILVTILAVPGFLYYLLQEKGKNRYRPLGIYGPKEVAQTYQVKRGKKIPDTIYHQIGEFKLLNQVGDTVAFKADTSQITIVNFFFTKCTSSCQAMNSELKRVVDSYSRNKMVRFFSISVDPEHDSPEVLHKYAASFDAEPSKWGFLTGSKDSIYSLARTGFLVDVMQDTANAGNIIHSPMFILVDPKKRIRGYYDSNSKEQVNKLIDEVKVQIAEQLRQVTDR